MLVKAPTQVFDDHAVRRTVASVQKAGNFVSRDKMWIRRCAPCLVSMWSTLRACFVRETIEKLVTFADEVTQHSQAALLFLVTYIFLLRLPSEALALTIGAESSSQTIFLEDGQLVLMLARRRDVHVLCILALTSAYDQEEQGNG